MGRIEEALRQAGLDTGSPESGGNGAHVFVSAWPAPGTAGPASPASPARAHLRPSINKTFRSFAPEWLDRLALPGNPNHVLIEQFRQLASALHHAQVNGKLKSLMVTSALPGDGKTFTSINLALTLAGSYMKRVLLIDADLRRPSIDKICGISEVRGLSEGLRSETAQKLEVVELPNGLTFLPAGRPDPDPMSSLTSSRMKNILEEAEGQFDWIIVDAPPAVPLADAGLIGAMVDALLLVVRAGETQFSSVEKAIESLGRDRIFGVVLNGTSDIPRDYGAYYADRPTLSE